MAAELAELKERITETRPVKWVSSTRAVTWLKTSPTVGKVTNSEVFLWLTDKTGLLLTFLFIFVYTRLCSRTTTRNRKSEWTMSLEQGALTTEHQEETSENGKILSELHTSETSPRAAGYVRDGIRRVDDDVGGGKQLLRHPPVSGAVTRMQRTTHYTVRDSKQADAMAKNDAESEKKQMEITRSIVNMLASRNSGGE